MQILTFYNAVANNGKIVRPHYVREIRKNNKVVKRFKPSVIKGSIKLLLKAFLLAADRI